MSPFEVMQLLQTRKDIHWIYELEKSEIDVFMLNKYLVSNRRFLGLSQIMQKFEENPDKRQVLALLWSRIPKQDKTPFIPYIKKKDEQDEKYKPLLDKIQKALGISSRDMSFVKEYYIREIEKDKPSWFRKLGMDKDMWKKHGLDFKDATKGGKKEVKMGLGAFGI